MPKYIKTNLHSFLFDVSDLVSVFYHEYHQMAFKPSHPYDFWQLNLVFKGSMKIKIEDSVYSLSENQMFLIAPGTAFEILETVGFNNIGICCFVCSSPAMEALDLRVIDLAQTDVDFFNKFLHFGIDLFEQAYIPPLRGFKPKDGIAVGTLQALKLNLELFLISIYNHLTYTNPNNDVIFKTFDKGTTETVAKIKKFLSEHLGENLTIDEIAKHFQCSPTTLKHVFKVNTTYSIMDYFRRMKVEKATFLMQNSDLNITEISSELGFSSPEYFATVFKKIIGKTSSQYLKQIRTKKIQSHQKFALK